MKKVVAIGCSWTYGDELVDPNLVGTDKGFTWATKNDAYRLKHCYAGIVANHFDFAFENLGFPGASLESMRWALMWYLQQAEDLKDTIFLVGLTEPNRISWYNIMHQHNPTDMPWNRHMHSTWLSQRNPDIAQTWYDMHKIWLTHSYTPKWEKFNIDEAAMLFDYVRLRYGSTVMQFLSMENRYAPNVPSVLWAGTSLAQMLTSKQHELGINLFAPGGHPNEKGHQEIAKVLINHINSTILVE